MSDQSECTHEHRTQTEHTDQRVAGPVKTVTIRCDDCRKVTSTFAVPA